MMESTRRGTLGPLAHREIGHYVERTGWKEQQPQVEQKGWFRRNSWCKRYLRQEVTPMPLTT